MASRRRSRLQCSWTCSAACVVRQIPVDEAGGFAEMAAGAGVAFCPLVAPTSTDERISRVGEMATGFVYCVSVAGVTGVRDTLPAPWSF